jgi:hypothetical protein
MDREVPSTGSEEIELYIRTYYSLLRTTDEIQIRTLESVHSAMNSSLHPGAGSMEPDMAAFLYASLRLPPCIVQAERVVLGQSARVFIQRGVGDVETWEPVFARARRRRAFFDGRNTLAYYIASGSDIDDLIPMLTAFQIEWNKLHMKLRGEQTKAFIQQRLEDEESLAVLAKGAGIVLDDLMRLRTVWGPRFWDLLEAIAAGMKRFKVRLLSGSLNDYRRATFLWWQQIEDQVGSMLERPVYFVSSNPHSLVNLMSGFALRHEKRLIEFINQANQTSLLEEWHDIQARNVPSSRENFLYYVLKKYLQTPEGRELAEARREEEVAHGIQRVAGKSTFDLQAQVIELARLNPEEMDPRLRIPGVEGLRGSDALILNIDYPLGLAAYLILTQVASRVGELRGIYILGKAATLNGVIGDVMIPSVTHDEHSKNTYLYPNCFQARDVSGYLVYGTVLDNQKTVSVRGTFLQTPRYMDVFYREGYTDIEMEAGPYLSAVYELHRPKRHPEDEIVNLYGLPFDLGILHYASDTPLTKGKNLGAGSLSYFGMDPTYACSIAVLRRVFALELSRLGQSRQAPGHVALPS